MSKYEPTSSGFREVDDTDKDKAAITEAVTPEKKISGTEEESPADKGTTKKEKKAKGGKKGRGRTDPGTGKPSTSAAVDDKNRTYPHDKVGAEKGPSGKQLALETNYTVPYPELGGHTVSQLANMETHKRKSILGAKDDEFVKNYF
jgi:hypothetical protein